MQIRSTLVDPHPLMGPLRIRAGFVEFFVVVYASRKIFEEDSCSHHGGVRLGQSGATNEGKTLVVLHEHLVECFVPNHLVVVVRVRVICV